MEKKPKVESQAELFTDANKAREHFEKLRWPGGPECPHCGLVGQAYRLQGKTTRAGLYKCSGCRKKFTVTMRTIFEDSHIPLNMWFYAIHLMCASKKGMSAYQFHRMTETFYGRKVSYRTAWFMFHRIRYAMTQHPLVDMLKGVVEVDEAYIGPKPRRGRKPGYADRKAPVVSMMERDGNVRSFAVERVTLENIQPILKANVCQTATIHTDDHPIYTFVGPRYAGHDVVTHSLNEYARRENGKLITTNTVEGFFGLVKRGIYGTFHHVGRPYLQQYLNEFDFRYNHRKVTDAERADSAMKACEGKRLTLRRPTPIQ